MRTSRVAASLLPAMVLLSACGAIRIGIGPRPTQSPAPKPVTISAPPQSQPPSATIASAPSPPSTPVSPSSAAETGWAGLVARLRGGVVRLQVAGCDPGQAWMGSGFAVGKHLIMTAGHVVRGGRTVSVKADNVISTAQVIDYDMATDSALLYTPASFTGQTLHVSTSPLELGSDLAILGYPLGVNDLRISTGVVSGLDQQAAYGDFTLGHAFVTDAATNGGNSGGPVIDRSGAVIGLVSGSREWAGERGGDRVPVQGTNFIVPAASLTANLSRWHTESPHPGSTCQGDRPPAGSVTSVAVSVHSDHPHARDVALTLALEGEGINTGNYEAAWNLFTPKMQHDMGSLSRWKQGLDTSFWVSLDVDAVSGTGSTLTIKTTLQTQQDAKNGYHGQTCSVFHLTYTMRLVNGIWLIDHASGGTPAAC